MKRSGEDEGELMGEPEEVDLVGGQCEPVECKEEVIFVHLF